MASASKNIFWLSLSRAAALVLLAIAYIFLFRYLGKFGTGQHQFVLSYVTIFGVIVDFGIQQYIIKKMSEEPGQTKKYFQNFLVVEIVLALLVYAVMVVIAYLNHYEPVIVHAIMVAGVGMVINGLTYPFLSIMSAHHDLKKVAFINFLNSLINIAIIFLTIAFHRYIVFLVTNQLIFGLLGLVLYSRFVRKHVPRPEVFKSFQNVDKVLIKKIFYAAWPFALLVGFSTIYNRIDTILIYRILGTVPTGLYAGVYKFFDLIGFFPSVVSFSLYPVFAGLMARKALPEVRTHIERYLRVLIAIALPMGVGGSLLALPLIHVLAGPEFLEAAPVLALLVWAPAILIVYIVANSLVISQLTKFAVAVTATNVCINIIGNIVLLPYVGIRGAAIMTIISEAIQGIFYFYFVYTKITTFHFFRYVWRPLLASAAMGVVLWWFKLVHVSQYVPSFPVTGPVVIELAISVTIGGLVYAVVLWVVRFYCDEDLDFVKSFFKRA